MPFMALLCAAVSAGAASVLVASSNSAMATERTALFAPVCAHQEVKIITLIEDHGAAADISSAELAAASSAMLQARTMCYASRPDEAVSLYTAIMKTVVSLGAFNASHALSSHPVHPHSAGAEEDWTALTMEPGGAWGTATDTFVNQAIAGAIRNCKGMSGKAIGCGAALTMIQAGWSLGLRCGENNVIVAEKKLPDAVQRAIDREVELRQLYYPDLPICAWVVAVDPHGIIVAPKLEYSGQMTLPVRDAVAR